MQKRAAACTAEDVLKVDETGLFNYRGNVIFVFGDKLLGDLPENVTAEISEDLINNFHMVPMELTEEEELRELDQILSSGGWEIHIMVYTSFLGALKPFFAEAGYPINIITNLYGHTGAKKTVYARLLYIYFNKDGRSNNECWSSFQIVKKKEIIDKIKKNVGLNYVIDDMHIGEEGNKIDHRREKEILDTIERTSEYYSSRANIVFTSEERANCQLSILDRQIQIPINLKNGTKVISMLEKKPWLFSTITMHFIEKLVLNYSSVKKMIEEEMSELYNSKSELTRTDEHKGIILLVQKLFLELYVPENYRRVFAMKYDIRAFLDELSDAKKKHMDKQYSYDFEKDPCIWVFKLLGSDLLNVVDNPKELKKDSKGVYYFGDYACMRRATLKFGLLKMFDDGQDRTRVTVKALADQDIIETTVDSNQKNYTEKIPQCQIRGIRINTKVLDDYVELARNLFQD